ncbi:unnamed protein product [Cyprideis torosa]|uniref:Uncharacterized protein n=1 Tax=Cyprideis torosa TaxID=163714 RepID=A0A7R8W544_9CRUS|nr:unnamed protein product [Cyprideis torosa]CAG0881320.1 unnamed protein product [Cyprideis torosa]
MRTSVRRRTVRRGPFCNNKFLGAQVIMSVMAPMVGDAQTGAPTAKVTVSKGGARKVVLSTWTRRREARKLSSLFPGASPHEVSLAVAPIDTPSARAVDRIPGDSGSDQLTVTEYDLPTMADTEESTPELDCDDSASSTVSEGCLPDDLEKKMT